MLKVKATIRTLNLKKTLETEKEVYEEETVHFLVASTKSFNNLMDDLKAINKTPAKVEKTELFLDREETEREINGMVECLVKDNEYKALVFDHIMNALDGACVFRKPPVIRKK